MNTFAVGELHTSELTLAQNFYPDVLVEEKLSFPPYFNGIFTKSL